MSHKKKWLGAAALTVLLCTAAGVHSAAQTKSYETAKPAPLSYSLNKKSMNGYTLDQYPGLLEELETADNKGEGREWHFVTVRYRRDTGEMRWTYANKLAWDTLIAGRTDYPDGAVFAKVGILTQDDPAFTSSVEPSGAKRFQLMVYDREKHKDTDGWGYALFDNSKRVNDEDDQDQARACHACHEIVANRNYVFSQPISMAVMKPATMEIFKNQAASALPFETRPYDALPEAVQAALPDGTKTVRVLTGKLQKYLFQGTLDEIRPALAQESAHTGLPAVLFSENGERFSLVHVEAETECTLLSGEKGLNMRAAFTMAGAEGQPVTGLPVTLPFCQPVPPKAAETK